MKIVVTLALLLTVVSSHAFDSISASDRIQSNNPSIIEKAEQLTSGYKTDLEKSYAIHQFVTSTISYDQATANLIVQGETVSYVQDALTTYKKNLAVCEGYANLTAALHRAIGIPAKVVIGKHYYFSYRLFSTLKKIGRVPDVTKAFGLHAWNEIEIDGKWIPMDTTADAGSSSGGAWTRDVKEEFFNPDPEYFKATHLRQGEMNQ